MTTQMAVSGKGLLRDPESITEAHVTAYAIYHRTTDEISIESTGMQ